jgi:7-carboxy-7-deazaguanine synthase
MQPRLRLRLEKTEGVFGPTIQGEGTNIGQAVSFVRFYGCDFRCSWCDTPFSLGTDKGGTFDLVTPEEVIARLDAIGCKNVVISGGNPLIQPRATLDAFFIELVRSGYWVQVETQGSIFPSPVVLNMTDFWSLSPKLPSAGKMESENWNAVNLFIEHVPAKALQLKFVISNDEDYNYVKERITKSLIRNHFFVPIILQPEGLQLETFDIDYYRSRLDYLSNLVGADQPFWGDYKTVRVLPQLHKVIWGVERKR